MDPGERKCVHAMLVLYQHWSPALLACNKEQSTMSMVTGDDSGATDREAMEPPIAVVRATAMQVTEPPIAVVGATGREVTEPPCDCCGQCSHNTSHDNKEESSEEEQVHMVSPWN